MTGPALYVYAVIPDIGRRDWGHIGLDGAQVRAESAGPVAALVHEVPAARPYQGTDAQVRDWVLQHSRVVEQGWDAAGTVLPVSFDVLVRGDDVTPAPQHLRRWLEDTQTTLTAALERFRDRVELKIELGFRSGAENAAPGTPEPTATTPAGGRQRLLEKKRALECAQALHRRADDLYQTVRRRLAGQAEDLVEHRRGHAEGMMSVFCGSLLVPRAGIELVGAELAQLQREEPDLVIRFLGPWPPYSFADAVLSSGASSAKGTCQPAE
jgi:hypothetical protein